MDASAPGGSRTPNLLIRSYLALNGVLDQAIRTEELGETGGVIRCPDIEGSDCRYIERPRLPIYSGTRRTSWPAEPLKQHLHRF
jgi:hypothetical protein